MIKILIASGFFANGTSGNITWGSLAQVYDAFEIVGEAQQIGGNISQIHIYFNGDFTETNYNSRRVQSLAVSQQNTAGNNAIAGIDAGTANTGAGNYRATVHKMITSPAWSPVRKYAYDMGYGAYNYLGTDQGVECANMQWKGTAAITQIDVRGSSTNLLTSGTQLWLYGLKHQRVAVSGLLGPATITNGLIVP